MIGWFNPLQTAGFELEYGVYTPVVSGLGSRSSEEPHVFGPLEPGPLEKNSRSRGRLEKSAGAGFKTAKKLAGSPALVNIS